jgi:hypothetical protein
MKVRALRGVCIGVERHLVAGDTADLPPAEVPFLVSIKAVEVVKDEPPPVPAPDPPQPTEPQPTPKKHGK